jgi:hypothetical protein
MMRRERQLDEDFNMSWGENTQHTMISSFGKDLAQGFFHRSKRVAWEGGMAPFHLPSIFHERNERVEFESNVLERTIWKMKRYKLSIEQNEHLPHKRIDKEIRWLRYIPERIWVLPEGGLR